MRLEKTTLMAIHLILMLSTSFAREKNLSFDQIKDDLETSNIELSLNKTELKTPTTMFPYLYALLGAKVTPLNSFTCLKDTIIQWGLVGLSDWDHIEIFQKFPNPIVLKE